ncbi:MAG: aldehyde dehydrogenase family protein, partial [Desulfobacterales bacterium]|nr:aldehyde dehydrogenase family protein [Desulfobacterales bacterium]
MQTIRETFELDAVQSGAYSGEWLACNGLVAACRSPIDGREIGRIRTATRDEYEEVLRRSVAAFREWRAWPAPRRGEVVRRMGMALRAYKTELGALVSREVGKIRAEGEGEVQEM